MVSRRDQFQSYQFLVNRVVSAMLMAETDAAQAPPRRGIGALFAGAMIAMIVAAGFGVAGILTKVGGDDWRTEAAVIVERETGATYVYLDGTLHPALNYASALLISGRSFVEPFRVSSSALAGVPRGVPLGIPGAPTSLPHRDRVVRGPWSLCAHPVTDDAGRSQTGTTLVVGDTLARARTVDPDAALLVRTVQPAETYLIWRGHRHLVRQADTVLAALYAGPLPTAPVTPAWLNALPEGQEIAPIEVADFGEPAVTPQWNVGTILVSQTGTGPRYFVVLADGLAPITDLQRVLIQIRHDVTPVDVSLATVNETETSSGFTATEPDQGQLPSTPPPLAEVEPGQAACVVSEDASGHLSLTVGGELPTTAIVTTSQSVDGAPLADRVAIAAGSVAVVEAMPAQSAPTGTLSIVTDTGHAFVVPSPAVLAMLGYQAEDVMRLPVAFVQRLPVGPALDPDAARQPASAA